MPTNDAPRPVFSLSRRAPISRSALSCTNTSSSACKDRKKKRSAYRSRKLPIPSFDAERERLAQIFSEDDDDDLPRKRRRHIPIPKFKSTPESFNDDNDDDDDDAFLLSKPVFSKEIKPNDLLQAAVDQEFRCADFEQTTVKEILSAINKRLGRSLSRQDRQAAKQRLQHLIQENKNVDAAAELAPVVSADSVKFFDDSLVSSSPSDINENTNSLQESQTKENQQVETKVLNKSLRENESAVEMAACFVASDTIPKAPKIDSEQDCAVNEVQQADTDELLSAFGRGR